MPRWTCCECGFSNNATSDKYNISKEKDLGLICSQCGLVNSFEEAFPEEYKDCKAGAKRTNYPCSFLLKSGKEFDLTDKEWTREKFAVAKSSHNISWKDNGGKKLSREEFLKEYKRDPQTWWGYHVQQNRARKSD